MVKKSYATSKGQPRKPANATKQPTRIRSVGPGNGKRAAPMIRRLTLKEMRDMQTPEQKRAVAYHEAGHAAIKFMFGIHYDIVHIDMRGTLARKASIRTQGVDWASIIGGLPRDLPGDIKSMHILVGKRLMMHHLAGYAAQHRVCPSEYGSWLDEQIDMNGLDWNEVDPHDTHDMARAVRIAKAIRGDNGNAWRSLRQMAAWTDEALSHPKLWAVVVALAEQLVAIKTRMSGNRICDIMGNAWEEGDVPYLKMGPQWRRRFPSVTITAPI
jgi:hypothetical protein